MINDDMMVGQCIVGDVIGKESIPKEDGLCVICQLWGAETPVMAKNNRCGECEVL